MMYKKAELFGDEDAMRRIMVTKDPRQQKEIGRSVKNFDVTIWNAVARSFVYEGNLAKFSQNEKMKEWLLFQKCELFVEASPYDAIWGIGFDKVNALANIDKWGTNWPGLEITNVRNVFISR